MSILFVQGFFELIGLGFFLSGYFMGISWLLLIGGCLIVLDDIVEIKIGVLSPVFPAILAAILAFVFTPWYVGVFWASGVFKVFNIPSSIRKMFYPFQKNSSETERTPKEIMSQWKEDSIKAGVVQRPLSKLLEKEKKLKEENTK